MFKRIVYFVMLAVSFGITISVTAAGKKQVDETIFIWGGDIDLKFTRYIADLTRKEHPRICYLPTASGDNPDNIKRWEFICKVLQIDTMILTVWQPTDNNKPFEELILNSDAIVVGGGNTLNMLGIWKAQGIDRALEKALKRGIILAGASAGSICWFQNGASDSRPEKLSIVDGLGFLPYSNCPHYSQASRQILYHDMIRKRKISGGYGTDELAGILFKNNRAVDYVTQSDRHNVYSVSLRHGKIKSEKLPARLLLLKGALAEGEYTVSPVDKNIRQLINVECPAPVAAYIAELKSQLSGRGFEKANVDRFLETGIKTLFVYDDKVAGVVNDANKETFGYTIWYFCNINGTWYSMGEDMGGHTPTEYEIAFREKAPSILNRVKAYTTVN